MLNFIKKNKLFLYIFLLCLIGGFLRFYNLNWGSPFYFHPDERNIASSVSQLNFPKQMNPYFFAYGSFPIYVIYFTSYLINLFLKPQDLFIQAILVSRIYSALLSLMLIPSVYFIGKKIFNKRVGLISSSFCAISTGFIQFSHFGTFEMWLTFLVIWLFYFSSKNVFITGAIFGLLVATKISSIPLLTIPAIAIILKYASKIKSLKLLLIYLILITIKIILVTYIGFLVFVITSPYVFLDFPSFVSSINYESSVAFGTLPVFYTSEFFSSIPIVFQFLRIYPFLINPILTIIFIPSFLYLIFKGIKTKNPKYLILNTCYLILFLPQAFLFTKWTRYIVPTLPFVYLIIAAAIENLFKKNTHYLLCILIFLSIIFSVSYFITAFVSQDTRIKASLWAGKNIPQNSNVLSEVYDMGIVPFNSYLNNISLFNFYDLDEIPKIKSPELESFLSKSDYIILPSQRILKTRLINQDLFPNGYNFYSELLSGKPGYQKIYETPCDIFCKITYLKNPVFSFEQTANVFDRPTVSIFKKI